MPSLTVVAGPNGSGKSSVIKYIDFAGRQNLLEVDAVAARMRSINRLAANIAASREVLLRTKRLLEDRQSFVIETTLSGSWTTKVIVSAIAQGFFVRLIYLCLDSPDFKYPTCPRASLPRRP